MTGEKKQDDFLKILEAHKGIIYKVSRAYCRQEEDRKDLIQDIITQIWNSLHKYSKQYKYSTWIYRIALNVAISSYRKEIVRQRQATLFTEEPLLFENTGTDDKEEEIALLYQVIQQLRAIDKALILLYLEQKSYNEIADIMDLSETNVATKLSRIKKEIKEKLLILKNK